MEKKRKKNCFLVKINEIDKNQQDLAIKKNRGKKDQGKGYNMVP